MHGLGSHAGLALQPSVTPGEENNLHSDKELSNNDFWPYKLPLLPFPVAQKTLFGT